MTAVVVATPPGPAATPAPSAAGPVATAADPSPLRIAVAAAAPSHQGAAQPAAGQPAAAAPAILIKGETSDYLAAVSRMIRRAGERVAVADMEQLEQLLALRSDLEDAIAAAVPGVIDNGGYSWTDIGAAAGITRQSAHERWGPNRRRTDRQPARRGRPVPGRA